MARAHGPGRTLPSLPQLKSRHGAIWPLTARASLMVIQQPGLDRGGLTRASWWHLGYGHLPLILLMPVCPQMAGSAHTCTQRGSSVALGMRQMRERDHHPISLSITTPPSSLTLIVTQHMSLELSQRGRGAARRQRCLPVKAACEGTAALKSPTLVLSSMSHIVRTPGPASIALSPTCRNHTKSLTTESTRRPSILAYICSTSVSIGERTMSDPWSCVEEAHAPLP